MEITWLGAGEETWWITELEERFNVDIQLNGVARHDSEAEQITIAAGEFPDTGAPGWGSIDEKRKLYDEAVIRSIPESALRANAPNYSKAMDTRYPAIWTTWESPDSADEQLAMGAIAENGMAGVFHLFTRKDWLDNLGIELPAYEATKQELNNSIFYYENDALTLDWIESTLIAYRDGDADGNGRVDTIPLGGYTQGNSYTAWVWGAIQGALGMPRPLLDRNHYVDGKLYISLVSPRFRELAELAAKWWSLDLIDNEMFTIKRAASWEKAATGAFGMFNSNYNYVGRVPARPPDNMIPAEAQANGAELVMFAPIGPRGEQFSPMYAPSYIRSQVQLMNRNLSDAKMARVLQIMDTKYTVDNGTEDGVRSWINWQYEFGKEDVHWRWSGEPFRSKVTAISADERTPEAGAIGGFVTNYPNYNPPAYNATIYPGQQADWIVNHLFGERVKSQTFATEFIDLDGVTNYTDVVTRRGEALQTMAQEFFARAVIGEIDIASEWDNYVEDFMNAGGNELMAEIEKMPKWADFF